MLKSNNILHSRAYAAALSTQLAVDEKKKINLPVN
jgi:hypothetical protein